MTDPLILGPRPTALEILADRTAAGDREAYPAVWRHVDMLPKKVRAEIEALFRRAYLQGAIGGNILQEREAHARTR